MLHRTNLISNFVDSAKSVVRLNCISVGKEEGHYPKNNLFVEMSEEIQLIYGSGEGMDERVDRTSV